MGEYDDLSEAELDAALTESIGGTVERPVSREELEAVDAALVEQGREPVAPDPGSDLEPELERELAPEPEPEIEEPEYEPDEVDFRELAERRGRELAAAQLHASRLAGEIGHLRKHGARSEADEADGDYRSQQFETALQEQQARLEVLEADRIAAHRTAVSRSIGDRIEQDLGGFTVADEPAMRVSLERRREELEALAQETDPVRVEAGTRYILESVAADVREVRRSRLNAVRTAQTHDTIARKRAATVSGGGAVSATRSHKSYDEMTPQELDQAMDAEFGVYGKR
jgi:hypothetical protein